MTTTTYNPMIPGYEIRSQLYAGSRTNVYRAIRKFDQLAVVIKILASEYPNFHELLQFRNQYTISKNLDIPGIIQPLSLETYANGYILVMADTGGISLREYLKNNSLSLIEFLNIAIQLADIIHDLHQNRVIHKDIKPANILIHPQTKQVKLIDFSIASLLPKETTEIKNPHVLEGTLAYISPEQTGRMNRGIDYRSDYYALGVTFYELLTRDLPFTSVEPMELVHCHLAQKPNAIKCENIPQVVAEIVMKLLAKNAEDRYQSAWGLKHDLQLCLSQLKDTGTIINFAIATWDICDRFLIPEKLYGREAEVFTLLQAFERVTKGKSEMMLVAGFSGIGKTAVVNEVHKPITRQQGYFVKGKFDQFNRNIPFFAFVQVFRDLMGQLLSESDTQLQTWKLRILKALGDQAQVIIEVIPELEQIIGAQPPAAELSGTAAQNRFNLLLEKFIQVFTTPEHPLVIFLDDLQWADSASLKLIELLMGESSTGYLLLIGAYRDNEVFAAHPLMLTLDAIAKTTATLNFITLNPLAHKSLNQLVADTLHCPETLAQPLTELVYQKTQGNPFFATQFLKTLYQDELINFDHQARHWQCDITQVLAAALTDDVVELMAQQLRKLPPETQSVLKLAACIGNQFDLGTLAIVSEKSQVEIADALWKALQTGLVLPKSDLYKFYLGQEQRDINTNIIADVAYRFLHDRVQQAAYSLIAEADKQTIHYQIGQHLLRELSEPQRKEQIFDIVNHLTLAINLLSTNVERETLAELALIAGQKAKSATAYHAALEYFTMAIALAADSPWKRNYELNLKLHEQAAETAYLTGKFHQMYELISPVLQNARSILDQVNIYEILIQGQIAQNNLPQALATAVSTLKLMGIEFPENINQDDARCHLENFHIYFNSHLLQQQLNHGEQTQNPLYLGQIKILASVVSAAYQSASPLLIYFITKQIELAVKFGNSPISAFSYIWYSLIISGVLNDIDSSFQIGQLSLQLLSTLPNQVIHAKVLNMAYAFNQIWKRHVRDALEPLVIGYQSGIATGDLEYAAYAAYNHCGLAYCAGIELEHLRHKMQAYGTAIEQFKQETALNFHRIFWQSVINWLETSKNPGCLAGEVYSEAEMLPLHQSSNDRYAICTLYINKLILAYGFEQYQQAQEYAIIAEEYAPAVAGSFKFSLIYFYASLAKLANYNSLDDHRQQAILADVAAHQTKLQAWATHAPMNHAHKFDLVQAECARVVGDRLTALELYDQAIAAAKASEYIQEEALANELAAKFYLEWKKPKIAASYMQSAYYCYAHWGAKAKTDDLEKRYPHLLRPILQPTAAILNPLETLAAFTTTHLGNLESQSTATSSSSSINSVLDLTSILKASQAISSTIQLDELLHKLTQIILQHSGGDRCALILPNSQGEWYLRAIATPETTALCTEPLENHPNLPVKVIQYVKNTQKMVVIDEFQTNLPVIDEYLHQHQPKSLLCLPILNQGQLIGILSLKNHHTSGVFTSDRILILNFLCTQAAISLENAQLHAQELEKSYYLEQSQQRLQLMIQQTPVAVMEWNTNFEFQSWNPAAEKIFGYGVEEVLGQHFRCIIPPEYHAYVDDVGQSILAQQGGSHAINENLTKDGRRIFCEWFNAPMLNSQGEVYGGVSMALDISDRQQAEAAIAQKSQELEQALQELQQTQLQMVQNEKMSALGNLVAGVAHEMNNPLGFISASLQHAKPTLADITEHLQLYKQYFNDPVDEIIDHAEEIDLDYTLEDLPKIIDAMVMACDRLKNISTSLRIFSRADKDYKVHFNINEGIDSTILILKHRLKGNENRPEIVVVTEYNNSPSIACFPGQLNQVFMNILANAIDALDEASVGRSFEEMKLNPHKITVKTAVDDRHLNISIADNGPGMSEAVKTHIFDHLFTTKGVGKGTGLGLAIARQIVEETHSGKIEVHSVLGAGTEFVISIPITD